MNGLRNKLRMFNLKEKWNHDGFQKYFANTGWLFVGKIFSLILSFFLFSFIARYLGAENLGKLSYAQSYVSLLAVFASFGIDHVLYRDIVRFKEKRNEILGSAIALKIALGCLTAIFTLIIALISESEQLIIMLIGILALTNIFQPFTLPSFYFDSVQNSKVNTIGMISSTILLSILKILIIVFDQGLLFFAAVFVIEAIINGVYYIVVYSYYYESFKKWRVNISLIKSLLSESFPLFLASISVVIYARIDQIMIKQYLDSSAVGLYAVAVKIAEIWSFIPALIIFSLFPAIINAKISNERSYEKRFGGLLVGATFISIIFASIISFFADPIVRIIGGVEYLGAVAALRIYVWGVVAAVIFSVVQQLLVAENWTKITFYITMVGALINVVLNLWLIPLYGINGAAWSTLIAYSVMPFMLFAFSDVRKKYKSIFSK